VDLAVIRIDTTLLDSIQHCSNPSSEKQKKILILLIPDNHHVSSIEQFQGYTSKALIDAYQLWTVVSVFFLHHIQRALKVRQRHRKLLLTKIQPANVTTKLKSTYLL